MPVKIDQLVRSNRKTLSISISRDGKLIVKAPYLLPQKVINDFIAKKEKWITTKLKSILKHADKFQEITLSDGVCIPLLGKQVMLQKKNGKSHFENDVLRLPLKNDGRNSKRLINWYKTFALKHLTARCSFWAEKTGLHFSGIKISSAKRRWGSCNASNSLSFSWGLILVPYDVIDYVIVHELAHVKEKNHSTKYWNLVEKIMPDYKEKERFLKEHSYYLSMRFSG